MNQRPVSFITDTLLSFSLRSPSSSILTAVTLPHSLISLFLFHPLLLSFPLLSFCPSFLWGTVSPALNLFFSSPLSLHPSSPLSLILLLALSCPCSLFPSSLHPPLATLLHLHLPLFFYLPLCQFTACLIREVDLEQTALERHLT